MSDQRRLDLIKAYYGLGMTHKEIAESLAQRHGISISVRHLQRILRHEGMSRRKYDNLQDPVAFIRQQLMGSGCLHGYRWMHQKCLDNGIRVRKEDVRILMTLLDPAGTEQRKQHKLRRRAYRSSGPNHLWHVDSYDKLKPFGICINGCIDGFSRRLIWVNAYHNSSDPHLIGGYFMEAVQGLGGCPRIIRADRGTENTVVRDAQRHLRRNGRDAFSGEKSFLLGRSVCNQRIEAWWSILRKEFTDFWRSIFTSLKDQGTFDGHILDRNLIQFCFLALIQDDLDAVQRTWNSHLIRPSSNERVPSGRPNIMFFTPELYGAADCLCSVPDDDMETCMQGMRFRSTIACDADIHKAATSIMSQRNLKVPSDGYMAVDLYLILRDAITNLMQ